MANSTIVKTNNGNNIPADFASKVLAQVARRNTGTAATVTPEQYANVIEYIEQGTKIVDACHKSGISESTFYRLKRLQPDLQQAVAPAHEIGLAIRVGESLANLTELAMTGDHKTDQVNIRHKECSYRATMDHASRIDSTWSPKTQNLNINATVQVPDKFDLSGYLNR